MYGACFDVSATDATAVRDALSLVNGVSNGGLSPQPEVSRLPYPSPFLRSVAIDE